jgi:hypothetical protein
MNTYLYFTENERVLIILSKYPKSFSDAKLIYSKTGRLNAKHFSRLKQFKMTDGSYMMSEDLLMALARSFDLEFEDLWNIVYLNRTKIIEEDLDEFNFI